MLLVGACTSSDTTSDVSDPQSRPTGLIQDLASTIDGVDRVYDVYVPSGHWDAESTATLVVLLHGQRSSKDDLQGQSRAVSPYEQWQPVADANNILLLIPQGEKGSNGQRGWNDCRSDASGNPETDDVAFITAAVDHVGSSYRVDTDQLFAVGTSNGGHMSIRLAQEAAERFAGVAVIAAGMPINSRCTSSDLPVSALFMWGTADPIAPHNGGAMASNRGQILSADDSIAYWVERNGVDAAPVVTSFPDLDTGDDSTVERLLYEGGTDGAQVALYRVTGGGHTEPSIAAQYRRLFLRLVGNQNHDIEMADEVWEFFQNTRAR